MDSFLGDEMRLSGWEGRSRNKMERVCEAESGSIGVGEGVALLRATLLEPIAIGILANTSERGKI